MRTGGQLFDFFYEIAWSKNGKGGSKSSKSK